MSYFVYCKRCGHEWPAEHDPALTVTCPTCRAKPGSPCMRPSEHTLFGKGTVHADRDLLAESQGAYRHGTCPGPRPQPHELPQPSLGPLFEAVA